MDFGTILGLLNPLTWIERVVGYFRRPRLRVYFDLEETNHTVRLADLNNELGHFMHVMVSNDGAEIAKACAAQLIKLDILSDAGEFVPHPGFRSPFLLKWAHESDLGPRDIETDLPRRLDLCFGIKPRPAAFSFMTDRTPSGNQIDYPPGTYRTTVRVRGENAGGVDAAFLVTYRGVWNEFQVAEA